MSPLRICFPFVGDTIGGSHLAALELIQDLPPARAKAAIVLHQDGPLAERLRGGPVPFSPSPPVTLVSNGSIAGQAMGIARAAPALARFLRREHIDIVHTNDSRMHLTWGLAARLAGARFVWHKRNADDSRRQALFMRLADRVLTVSHFSKSRLPGGISRRAEVVLDPFDAPSTLPDREIERRRLLTELKAPLSAKIVGFVANLIERKRPLVFVEMAALVRARSKRDIVFPMFGDPRPPMRQRVEAKISELGLEGRCVLMGLRVPIEPLLAACDMIVAPGVEEPFGRAVIEPTLLGTPVVAANDGGNPEILTHGETGLLVRPDDAAAFADAVCLLLDDPAFASRLGLAARARAQTRFSRAKHAADVLAIYESLRP